MKTRDRILLTSLLLFNEEGEQNVTTVDIANEMDISPGNLYYHFKGKESIIDTLYSQYETELLSLLNQSTDKPLTIEEHWYFIYVIFEEIYKFRFFYLNSSDIVLRYPDIERRFRRLINNKVKTVETLCQHLIQQKALKDDLLDTQLLAENISLCLLYWFPYQHLLNPNVDDVTLIHKGVYHVLSLVAPYIDHGNQEFAQAIQALYKENT
ncbi:Nucleoid occlusion factor SlmA [BD1-7 clade bacterium]|uniref:Nucleoid occlusion factor SlmA n=1 Tax=BD1-7 clade bacterium TaxID=2029982 RepID=A0A5S9QLS8_9GAMM|nr:Nucleoid occlusion factor SlmA [BD1-7 clade bacterium]CAA0119427.1 Nucleoid occlusion factor SlmA [BD1-7 clade bacterium]CAA0120744.1 Nucleoid occlusion factor SlmA [BD1-7 clade bacterium]